MGNELTIAPTMGRPCSITHKVIAKLNKYTKKHSIIYNEDNKPMFSPFPTLAEFASKIKIAQTTFNRRAKDLDEEGLPVYPDLCLALKNLKDKQEAILSHNALAGTYKNSFAIFWAKNNLGWTDKTETHTIIDANVRIASLNVDMKPEDAAMGYKALLGD